MKCLLRPDSYEGDILYRYTIVLTSIEHVNDIHPRLQQTYLCEYHKY